MRCIHLVLKRIIDIVGGIFLLILLSPLLLIITCAVKLNSRGPAFFLQERLGYRGKVFKIIKFRTMVVNAEQMGSGIFTHRQDPRITAVGSLLRNSSLDELPQLFNVIKGEMSFVGPRPPLPYHPYTYEAYNDEQKLRFTVRPGITGYAQVKGRNAISWEERIKYDVEYVKKFSIFLDIKILFLTAWGIVRRENIYRKNL
ncbi:MAG TPA: sugar transferase [Candidatus Deferrimicrobium sp.]|nr:sugar transferase [Candidatus Deferrimicrobium sp.]